MRIRNFFRRLIRFGKDEGGMEALQTVLITAVASMVMMGAVTIGKKAVDSATRQTNIVTEESEKGLRAQLRDKATDAAGDAFDSVADKVESGVGDLLDF